MGNNNKLIIKKIMKIFIVISMILIHLIKYRLRFILTKVLCLYIYSKLNYSADCDMSCERNFAILTVLYFLLHYIIGVYFCILKSLKYGLNILEIFIKFQ